MARKPLTVKIKADTSHAKKGFRELDREATTLGGRLGGMFGSMGIRAPGPAAAIAGAAAVGGAIAKIGIDGVQAAAKYDRSMREVWTLLPEMSKTAYDRMTADVKNLSSEYGIMTNEVAPALYQAISAGVPKDNAMTFLGIAAEASIGGVTDLTTAVDGLTTVTNGYTFENVTAQQAADMMFTTVRLGKTTFDELARSYYNVIPAADAAGIGFDEVSAAMVVLTSKGVPTAQATTQLKAAFMELSKEGSIADKAFQRITHQTFPEFIRSGGSLQEALRLMAVDAERNSTGLNNYFSSMEAGQAVLSLTADGTESLAAANRALRNSTNAATQAYDTMAMSIDHRWNKVQVALDNASIAIGEALLPALDDLAGWLNKEENKQAIVDGTNMLMNLVGWWWKVRQIEVDVLQPLVDQVAKPFLGTDRGGDRGGMATYLPTPEDIIAAKAAQERRERLKNLGGPFLGAPWDENEHRRIKEDAEKKQKELADAAGKAFREKYRHVLGDNPSYLTKLFFEEVDAHLNAEGATGYTKIQSIADSSASVFINAFVGRFLTSGQIIANSLLAAIGAGVAIVNANPLLHADVQHAATVEGWYEQFGIIQSGAAGEAAKQWDLTPMARFGGGPEERKDWERRYAQDIIDAWLRDNPQPSVHTPQPEVSTGSSGSGSSTPVWSMAGPNQELTPEQLGMLEAGGFARGGIITRPTVALMGEAGPEAVVPLNRMGTGSGMGGAGRQPQIVVNHYGDSYDGPEFADRVENALHELIRGRGFALPGTTV